MPDPYYDEPHPAPEKGAAKSISIAQNIGPLPVWGWGAVVVGAVFLWRRLNPTAKAAAQVAGPQPPAYSPQSGGVYLLPNSTGTAPPPAPSYLPTLPNSGPGQAPPGATCPPGYTLIQGPNGHTCGTAADVQKLDQFLAGLPK